MNIFKKLYKKYIIGIGYPIDENSSTEEKLYHIGIDESDPFFDIYRDFLNHEPIIKQLVYKEICDLDRLHKAFVDKEVIFGHYIITSIELIDDNKLEVVYSYVDTDVNIYIESICRQNYIGYTLIVEEFGQYSLHKIPHHLSPSNLRINKPYDVQEEIAKFIDKYKDRKTYVHYDKWCCCALITYLINNCNNKFACIPENGRELHEKISNIKKGE